MDQAGPGRRRGQNHSYLSSRMRGRGVYRETERWIVREREEGDRVGWGEKENEGEKGVNGERGGWR